MKPTSFLSALVLILASTYASTPSTDISRRALTGPPPAGQPAGPPQAAAPRPAQAAPGTLPRPQAGALPPAQAQVKRPAAVPPNGLPNANAALSRPQAGLTANGRPGGAPNAAAAPRPLAGAGPNRPPAAPANAAVAPLQRPAAAAVPNGRPATAQGANTAPGQPASPGSTVMKPLLKMPDFAPSTCAVPGRLRKRDCPEEFGNVVYCFPARCFTTSRGRGYKVKRTFPGQVPGQCYNCGSHSYTDAQVDAAAMEADRLLSYSQQVSFISGLRQRQIYYPQKFGNTVGAGNNAQVITGLPTNINGRNSVVHLYEFPILRSGLLYRGTIAPGPDRVVLVYDYAGGGWTLRGVHVITHDGQTGNAYGFVQPI